MSPFLETFGFASVRGYRAGAVAPPAYELIQTQVLTSSQSAVNFSSIPQTYKHLQLRTVVKSDNGSSFDILLMRINGATSGYSQHALYGDGGASQVYSSGAASTANIQVGWVNGSSTTGAFAPSIIDILDYASTVKNKTVRSLSGTPTGLPRVFLYSGAYFSTTTVSSLSFVSNYAANWVAGSRFSLYGIKG